MIEHAGWGRDDFACLMAARAAALFRQQKKAKHARRASFGKDTVMACSRESEEGKTAVRELILTGAEVRCSGFILVGTSCQKMKKDRLKQSDGDCVQPVLWKSGRITEYEKGETGRSAFVFTVFYIVAPATVFSAVCNVAVMI